MNFVKKTCLVLMILGCLNLAADIHEKREWILKNGESLNLEFVNAYGPIAYFYHKKGQVSIPIHELTDTFQADIVLWSRKRDNDILNGQLPPTDFTKRFKRDARKLVNGDLVKPDWSGAGDPDFYAIYTSASWCGPCKRFTPSLVAGYNSSKALHGDRFEVLLCSWDKSQSKMKDYMEETGMTWFGTWSNRKDQYWRQYQSSGIPCFVVVDRNGYILSHSYTSEGYRGPVAPLKELYQLLKYTVDRPGGRLSVTTPGINVRKLGEMIRKHENKIRHAGEDSSPFPLTQPSELLQDLQDPEGEEVAIKVQIKLDAMGVVRSTKLISHSDQALAHALDRALSLWQFMPRVTVADGPVSAEIRMPVNLRIKPHPDVASDKKG